MSRKKKSRRRESSSLEADASKKQATSQPRLSWPKKLVFGLVVASAVMLLSELLLWATGVQPHYYQVDPYAGFARHIPHFVAATDEDGKQWMTVVPSKRGTLNDQRFLAQKPPGTYRVVCAGGSTTYGRPFFDHTSWPGWLRAFLPTADSSRRWEVINVGAISYASYRAAGLMKEMSQYDPDLFIVYAGHNEFLERRTYGRLAERPSWLTGAMAIASRTRTAAVMQRTLQLTGIVSAGPSTPAPQLGEAVQAIPLNVVGPEAYHRDPELTAEVATHFRATLDQMTEIAQQAGADIMFVTPASNLLDFAPFKSEHRRGLNKTQQEAWQRAFAAAEASAINSQHDVTLEQLGRAEAIDDQFASLLFLKGRSLYELGRYAESKETLIRARDEDICPLRAISPLVEIVRDVAVSRGVELIDFEKVVSHHSPNRIAARSMFHDHVHPTIEANRQLALEIILAMQGCQIVGRAATWGEETIARVSEQVEDQMNRPRCALQLRQLAVMMATLGQTDQAHDQAERSLELSGRTAEALRELGEGFTSQQAFNLAAIYYEESLSLDPSSAESRLGLGRAWTNLGRAEAAAEHLRAALKQNPNLSDAHTLLGVWLAGQGEMAAAEKHFLANVQLDGTNPTSHNNLGLAIASQGRYQEALAHYQRSLELAPQSSGTHYNLGLSLEQLDRLAEARLHFERALFHNPQHEGARSKLNHSGGVTP